MLRLLRNRFQFIGTSLIGIGFVYQSATPFFLSVGTVLIGLSALLPPFKINRNSSAIGILLLWFFTLLSGLWSSNLVHWWDISLRQLALALLPIAVLTGFNLNTKQTNVVNLIWVGITALFAIVSLARYLIHKEMIDLSLLESGAIPMWDGISSPLTLHAINSSKFDQSGINHIYFSLIQAFAIVFSFFQWTKIRKPIWLILGLIHLIAIHWFLARTGLLALYFAMGILFLYTAVVTKSRKLVIGILSLSIALPLASYFMFDAVQNKVRNSIEDIQAVKGDRSINHRSLAMRIEAWKTTWQIIKQSPFGVGAGDLDVELAKQYERDKSPLWLENRIPPHNQYLETAAASGIAASLLLLVILIGGMIRSWRNKNPFRLAVFSCFLVALLFESILQTQLGICIFPFMLLILNKLPKETTEPISIQYQP